MELLGLVLKFMIYELLLRFKNDGSYSGAHAIDFDESGNPGLPRPIGADDWPVVASAVNSQLQSSLTAAQTRAAEAQTRADTADATLARYAGVIAEADGTAAAKRKAELADQIAKLQAEAETLGD